MLIFKKVLHCLEKSQALLLFTTMGGRQSVYLVHDATNLSGTRCIMFSTMMSQLDYEKFWKTERWFKSIPILFSQTGEYAQKKIMFCDLFHLCYHRPIFQKVFVWFFRTLHKNNSYRNALMLYSYTRSNNMFQNTKFWITRRIGYIDISGLHSKQGFGSGGLQEWGAAPC